MVLSARIEILYNAKMISESVQQFALDCINIMEEECQDYDQSKAEMFITHLAMAMQRVEMEQSIDHLDEMIWKEVEKHEKLEQAKQVLERMNKVAKKNIPEVEERFILMHLCNLLS